MILKSILIFCAILVYCETKSFIDDRTYYEFEGRPYSLLRRPNGPPFETTTKNQDNVKEYSISDKGNEKEYFFSTEKLSWLDAKHACEQMGMVLVTTSTYTEKVDLENYLITHSMVPKDQYSGFWIGSRRQSANDPWVWTTNGEEITSQFGWLPGEPSSFEGEDCMEFKNDLDTMGWNNYYCNDPRRFACESSSYIFNELRKNFVQEPKQTLHEEFLKESAQPEKEIETSSRRDDQDISEDENLLMDMYMPIDKYMGKQYIESTEDDGNFYSDESIIIKPDEPLNEYQELSSLNYDDDALLKFFKNYKQTQLDNRNSSIQITKTTNQEPLQETESTDMHEEMIQDPYVAVISPLPELEPNQEPKSTTTIPKDYLYYAPEIVNMQFVNDNDVSRFRDSSEEVLSPLKVEEFKSWLYKDVDVDVVKDVEPENYSDYFPIDKYMGKQYIESTEDDGNFYSDESIIIKPDEPLNEYQELSSLNYDDDALLKFFKNYKQTQLDNRNSSIQITKTTNQEPLQETESTDMHEEIIQDPYVAVISPLPELELSPEPESTTTTPNDYLYYVPEL